MESLKVMFVNEESLTFEDGTQLFSDHEQDCCESHYLSFKDLSLEDFKDLEFDLTSDKFFERVEDYGIRLIPVRGHAISVPGYGSNNGYYSSKLALVLENNTTKVRKEFDITECQDITD
jgi:hypothetical protein